MNTQNEDQLETIGPTYIIIYVTVYSIAAVIGGVGNLLVSSKLIFPKKCQISNVSGDFDHHFQQKTESDAQCLHCQFVSVGFSDFVRHHAVKYFW